MTSSEQDPSHYEPNKPQIQTRNGLQSSECQYDYDYKAKQGSRGVDPPIHKPSSPTDHESTYYVEENEPKECKTQPDYQPKQSKAPSTKAQLQQPAIQLPPSQNLMSSLLSVQNSFDPDDSLQNNQRHPNEPSQPGENPQRDSERVCSSRKRGRWSFEQGLQIIDANSLQNFGFPQAAKSPSLIQKNSPIEPSQPRENPQQDPQMDRLCWTRSGAWSFRRGLQLTDANSLQNFRDPQSVESSSLIQQNNPNKPSQPGANPQTTKSLSPSSDVPSNPWATQVSNPMQGNAVSTRTSKKFKKLLGVCSKF